MATRLYLAAAIGPDAAITPSFWPSWGSTAQAVRRIMVPQAVAGDYSQYIDALATGAAVTSVAGSSTCHRQYISLPLAAGITFVSGVSTFSAQIMGLESALNDNIINRVRRVAVYDANMVLQADFVAGNATSVVEWNTTLRNLTFMSATAAINGWTTGAGDRLVFEVGHNDSGGASISGQMRFGITGQTGDLGANETDTTTTLRPWFESSVNLTFLKSDPLPRQDRWVSRSGVLVPAVGW